MALARTSTSADERADLLRKARVAFRLNSIVQLFGSGGRILTEDGRKLAFADLSELTRLIDQRRNSSSRSPELAR